MKINGQPLHKLKKSFRNARKALGHLNRLQDSAFRTVQRSKLFGNMNRLRAAINRALAEYKGVMIDFTAKHGFHFYINNVKSKAFNTLAECLTCVDILYNNKMRQKVAA